MLNDIRIYMEHTIAISSIEYPESIKKPKVTVANAVEKTINEPVKAFIEPK